MNKKHIKTIYKKWLDAILTNKYSQEIAFKKFIWPIQKHYQGMCDFFDEGIGPIISELILQIQKKITPTNTTIIPYIHVICKTMRDLYIQSWISKQSYLILKQSIERVRLKIQKLQHLNRVLIVRQNLHNPQHFNGRQSNRHIQGYDCLHQFSQTKENEGSKINEGERFYSRILSESFIRDVNGSEYFQPSINFPTQLSKIFGGEQSTLSINCSDIL